MKTKTHLPLATTAALALATTAALALATTAAPKTVQMIKTSSLYEAHNMVGNIYGMMVIMFLALAAAAAAALAFYKRASAAASAAAASAAAAANERTRLESSETLKRYYEVRSKALAADLDAANKSAAAAADAAAAAADAAAYQIKVLKMELTATRRAFQSALIAAAAASTTTAAADICIAASNRRYIAAVEKVKAGKGGTKLSAAVAYAAAVVRTAADGGDIVPTMIVEFNKALSLMWDETCTFDNGSDEIPWVGGVNPRIH